MNVTDMANSTTEGTTSAVTEGVTKSLTTLYTEANTTHNLVVTTALPPISDSTIVGVVIFVILLTVAVLGFVLYRYLCHKKGAYRTTGELAPGEDLDEDHHNQTGNEKKEYFI
ncbi:hypothetical protein NL108_016405 [Boleophthalmus pectinirostris]|nr:hypothetical protein NL108_016405 [Boleophthalmus pectinirostris]